MPASKNQHTSRHAAIGSYLRKADVRPAYMVEILESILEAKAVCLLSLEPPHLQYSISIIVACAGFDENIELLRVQATARLLVDASASCR